MSNTFEDSATKRTSSETFGETEDSRRPQAVVSDYLRPDGERVSIWR